MIKSSDINIMEKQSTGSVLDKEEIKSIFKEARLKIIDDNIEKNDGNTKKEEKETKQSEIIEKEKLEEKEIEPKKEEVFETLTMSDFFDEFKI